MSPTAGYNSLNQVTRTTANSAVNGFIYDGAGNVTNDGEGRICAVSSPTGMGGFRMVQYIYDAEGNRVAKGNISNWNAGCDTTRNGFTPTNAYVLGPSNEQLTETDGNGKWIHSNVYAAGMLIATYDMAPTGNPALHFQLEDWLGTRRVQTDESGDIEECYSSLPFGDGLSTKCVSGAPPTADDATEIHFTGKERDTESGNDYFGARYYASSMGRWMSPDDSLDGAIMELPQTWNKYSYEYNRPTYGTDPDGRCPPCAGAIIGGVVQGGFDLGKQLYNNGGSLSKVSWGEVGANTAGGALAGTIAVMTGGTSLVGSALVGDIAAGVTGNVIGGAVTGALDPNTPSDEVMSVGSVSSDALSGFVGGAGGHVAAEFVHVPEEPHFSMNGRNGRVNNQAYRTGLKNLATRDQALTQQEVRSGFVHRGTDMLKDFVNSWFLSGPHCHWQMESVDVTINGVTTHGQTSEHQVCN